MSAKKGTNKMTPDGAIAALTAQRAQLAETSPPTLNPMIAYVDQPDETAANVRDVLTFMAAALGNQAELDVQVAGGARLILEAAAAALDFHLDRARIAII